MINVSDKTRCCGCSACAQRCPKQCIKMIEDVEGFLFPYVDYDLCVNCGVCERVCPFININSINKPINTFAAFNNDDNKRLNSSSGGIFILIAEKIIRDGGVVFAARFNQNWQVVHDYTDSLDNLSVFMRSKYVQSVIGINYYLAELFLKQGRKVLFIGTPCQISGLKLFLRKEYKNLVTIDFVCHGVPSPKVWQKYLKEISLDYKITEVNFRAKQLDGFGWKKFGIIIKGVNYKGEEKILEKKPFNENLYMKGFLKDLFLRKSCYFCTVKKCGYRSDITIGDFWGIENNNPSLDDDKGTSLLICNSIIGKELLDCLSISLTAMDYQIVLKYNPAVIHSPRMTKKSKKFWNLFLSNNCLDKCVNIALKDNIYDILKAKLKYEISKFRNESSNNNTTFSK